MQHFFVTNQIKNKEIKVVCCPTEEMFADFFTEPVQGKLFIKCRNLILGINEGKHEIYQRNFNEVIKRCGELEPHKAA